MGSRDFEKKLIGKWMSRGREMKCEKPKCICDEGIYRSISSINLRWMPMPITSAFMFPSNY
jgi:hypothetical protein